MPAFSNLVINDGSVDRTFKPDNIDNNGVATFIESSGVPIGDRRFTVARTKTSGGRTKVSAKLVVPVVQDVTVGGVTRPTLVRTAYADLTWSFDNTSTEAERGAMRGMTATAITAIIPIIEDLETFY